MFETRERQEKFRSVRNLIKTRQYFEKVDTNNIIYFDKSVPIEPTVKKKEMKKTGKENKAPQISGKENIASLIKKGR